MTRAMRGAATVVLLTTVTEVARSQTAEAVLTAAGERYASIHTLAAPFTQTIVNPMLGAPVETRGMLYIEPPNRFAMRFSEPDGDRIVVDGEWMWAYAPSSVEGQVIRQRIPKSGGITPNLIAQFVERPLERYRVEYGGEGTVGGDAVDVVVLYPYNEDALGFKNATVSFSRSSRLPVRIDLTELSGQQRVIVLTRLQLNEPIDAAEFRFAVPRGVRVITP
jgi:outer membrane lipoprotein carrier protein